MSDAAALIARLDLKPHPEGGWYRETFRQPAPGNKRGLATVILFLLEQGQRSHWHRVDATEVWLWHAGSPLILSVDDGERREYRLGGDVMGGEIVQQIIPANAWQAAEARHGWVLVSCMVTPAFEFEGFELALPGWSPG